MSGILESDRLDVILFCVHRPVVRTGCASWRNCVEVLLITVALEDRFSCFKLARYPALNLDCIATSRRFNPASLNSDRDRSSVFKLAELSIAKGRQINRSRSGRFLRRVQLTKVERKTLKQSPSPASRMVEQKGSNRPSFTTSHSI